MSNFEEFLSKRGLPTDRSSIWDVMKDNFRKFYKNNKLFLYVGDGLNRTSDQLYLRLYSLYHNCKRDKTNAAEDGFILDQEMKLQKEGVRKRFRKIGDDLDRFSENVR